jgi:hypothetical protein
LSYDDKTNEYVKAIICNNYSTNQFLATKLGVPIIGCQSYIFNLVMNAYLDHHDDVVQIIHMIMGKLCNMKKVSELKKLTDLNPVKVNDAH